MKNGEALGQKKAGDPAITKRVTPDFCHHSHRTTLLRKGKSQGDEKTIGNREERFKKKEAMAKSQRDLHHFHRNKRLRNGRTNEGKRVSGRRGKNGKLEGREHG